MNKNRKISLQLVIFAVLIVVAGYLAFTCNQAEDKGIIKVGAILPLTGNMASLGESGQNGLILAQKYINDENLLKGGKKIEFVFEDGKGIPAISISALTHLTEVQNIDIIFSIVSAVDLSLVPKQKEKGFLFISHATHPSLSDVNDLFFRHSPTVTQEFALLKRYIGLDSALTILLHTSDDYGDALAREFGRDNFIAKENILAFNISDQNFRGVCSKIIHKKPYRVVIGGNGKELYQLVNILREQGYKNEIITTLGFKVGGAFNQLKEPSNLSYIDFKDSDPDEKYNRIQADYKKMFGKDMTISEMIFFNSALLITEAINKCAREGGIKDIARQLATMESFEGLGETITISASNDILPDIDIFSVKDKKIKQ
ncbi:ABC transporter substrate-binding protein [Porphyromonas canoris]|uniref:Leucine-binding protein domain-containing protein n=1 Tax=Porphyromonas canoris TaxID=36875 RepID=A0ABR4XKU8_9PORP|nr:ABC transporter substrate-binding protein [Porphyromonas canoris]KGN92070.1 hypothetical protein HQ43_08495 [Porphyromonas canoris]